MSKVSILLGSWAKYFRLLVFSCAAFLIGEMLRISDTFMPYYGTPWLDALANYALLASLGIGVACVVSAVLAGTERVLSRGHRLSGRLPRGIAFVVVFVVWLNILRSLLSSFGIRIALSPAFQVLLMAMMGGVVFTMFGAALTFWIDELGSRLRWPSRFIVVAALLLTAYLFLEPLYPGAQAPVALKGPVQKAPNVVVVLFDSLTARDMSVYGYHLPTTPNLDRLTQTWTVYEAAHSFGTGTRAAMPAIFTGRYPYTDDWSRYGDLVRSGQGWLSLPQVLKSFGYETARLSGGGNYPPSIYHLHSGFNRWLNDRFQLPGSNILRGTLFWRALAIDPILTEYTSGSQSTSTSVAEAAEISVTSATWSEPIYGIAESYFREKASSTDGRPFFAYLHIMRPNGPYIANQFLGTFLPVDAGLADIQSQQRLLHKDYRPEQQTTIDQLRLRYDENIRLADEEIGELIETLRSLGLYDQTLIIITADHGTSFAEGHQGYASPLLAAAEHAIPLLVKYPSQTTGQRVSATVSNVDVLPTVLDVIGADYPSSWVDGQSLRRAGVDPKRVVYVRRPGDPTTYAAISDNLKLVNRAGVVHLYNLADDPTEQHDLQATVQAAELRSALDGFAKRRQLIDEGVAVSQVQPIIATLPANLFNVIPKP